MGKKKNKKKNAADEPHRMHSGKIRLTHDNHPGVMKLKSPDGFRVIKFGRTGVPHERAFRLSRDGDGPGSWPGER